VSAASAELSSRVAPSIVQVHGRRRGPASGIVIDKARVLTTSHSVEWDEGVKVRLEENRTLDATVVGHDRGADLVVLNVPGLESPSLSFDTAAAGVGALTLLVGRSWRGNQHVRLTMVSGIGGPVHTRDGSRLDRVLALSTPPYPGFSGSAVLTPGGGLAGVATAGIVRGAGLAVPADAAAAIVRTIEEHGGVRRGFLGVTSHPANIPARQKGSVASDRGLVVLGIADDSPADRAGLLVGDIIVKADGTTLETPEDLLALLGPERVGRPLELLLIRGAGAQAVTLTVGERPRRF
jgi:S1-C subfamily serine protease